MPRYMNPEVGISPLVDVDTTGNKPFIRLAKLALLIFT